MRYKLFLATIVFGVVATSFAPPEQTSNYKIIIDKSDYELQVFDEEGWVATYPVVFGNNDQGDKMVQGDRKTPEGNFKINAIRNHAKWVKFMALDYPTKASRELFEARKKAGKIPAKAKLGGDVGIHGTWPHDDYLIDNYTNWTLGCIALKNDDLIDLYETIGVGTTVEIRK
jgi:murein L,D-transpeptidase YafK